MEKLLIVLVAFLATSLATPLSSRVVGGYIAQNGQFPYMASIRIGDFHLCGGTIVSQNWILTAAHCLYGNEKPLNVVVGTNHLSYGGDRYLVAQSIYHQNYNPANMLNDVGLLRLQSPIQYSPSVQPISLSSDYIMEGQPLTVSGWGNIAANSPASEALLYLTYNTINLQTCKQMLAPAEITDTQICLFVGSQHGSCKGDSGGPIALNGVQYGIVSWGKPCALGYPDVYTRVYSFLPWIQNVMSTM